MKMKDWETTLMIAGLCAVMGFLAMPHWQPQAVTVAELTAEQRQLVNNFMNQTRAHVGGLARTVHINNKMLLAAYDTQIAPLGIDATEVLTNTSGLGGAQSVTYAQLEAVIADMRLIDNGIGTGTHLSRWLPFAGVNATFGN